MAMPRPMTTTAGAKAISTRGLRSRVSGTVDDLASHMLLVHGGGGGTRKNARCMKVQNKINDTIMLNFEFGHHGVSRSVVYRQHRRHFFRCRLCCYRRRRRCRRCRFYHYRSHCCVFLPPLPAPTIATVVCRRLAAVAPATIADPVPSADTAAFLVLFEHQPDFKF